MFYAFRVNKALADLGGSPKVIDANMRVLMLRAGKQSGKSPQEVALRMVAQLPLMFRTNLNVGSIREWLRTRKINPDAPEVRDALGQLSVSDIL